MISIIIPTLNEEGNLRALLAGLGGAGQHEIIVVDGGSSDATARVAGEYGVSFYRTPPGRGCQLARGAEKAGGDWLLFLHADCRLPPDWRELLEAHRRKQPEKAMAFSLKLDDDSPAARMLEAVVRWRCRLLALPYGDQGLFIPRVLYEKAGGFSPLVLMEDVDLIRRIGRRRVVLSPVEIIASAVRYKRDGYFRRMTRNMVCLMLYFIGVPVETIKKLYG
jgi:rSAM/selenodomain-associated transferase 2